MLNIHSKGFKRYFANTSWMMVEKVVSMIVALFVGVYVARYLGPERFGILSYAISFVGLFSAIATLGLDNILVRNLVQNPEDREKLLGTAFILKIIGAITSFGIIALALQLTSNDAFTQLLVLIIAGGILFQSFNVIDFYFQSRVESKFITIARGCSLFVSSAMKIILVIANASLFWFACVVVIGNIIMGLALVVIYIKRRFKIFKWRFEWQIAVDLLRDSWLLIFSSLSVIAYMRIDQIMIKEMLDSKALGNYAAAVRLSEVWYFIPMVLCTSLFPAIINSKKISETFYYQRLQKLYDLMVWMAIAVAIPTTFLADYIIYLFFGSEYEIAGGILKIHVWAGVFVFLGVPTMKWLIVENLQLYMFYRSISGLIINIILNLLLINKMDITGAALSTLIARCFASYLFYAFFKKNRKIFWLQTKALFFPFIFFKLREK
ncbi:O-unit flippase [Candidatus Magnetomoraceae bacterium gMMP-15]